MGPGQWEGRKKGPAQGPGREGTTGSQVQGQENHLTVQQEAKSETGRAWHAEPADKMKTVFYLKALRRHEV